MQQATLFIIKSIYISLCIFGCIPYNESSVCLIISFICTLPLIGVSLFVYVYFCYLMCIVLLCIDILYTLVAGLLARSQYTESLLTGHHGTGFSWFPCVYKLMLRWFPRLQVATRCFSSSLPNLNFLDP
jgi:hypothetical protein